MKNSIFKSYSKKILKSEAFISVIIVCALAFGIIGSSYALYMDVDKDTNYQVMNVGNLAISFDNGDNTIDLANMIPSEDSIAKTQTDNVFSFYIYNTGTFTTDYDIKLVTLDGNQVDTQYINYQLCINNGSNCEDITTLSTKTDSIIYKDELTAKKTTDASNPSVYYFLRVWINNQYPNSDTAKSIKLKVVVDAKNASGEKDSNNTLAGAILNNPNIAINNNIPNFTNIETNEVGLYKAKDDYGISYYFRGKSSYNYVNFAGLPWRIVRINGDGSIRIALNGSTRLIKKNNVAVGTQSQFNPNTDNAYVGYMYGLTGVETDQDRCLTLESNNVVDKIETYSTKESCERNGGKWTTTAYEATHANLKDSYIKKNVDKFYETYIENSANNLHYEKYLADNEFCGDKTLTNKEYGYNNTGKGYSHYHTYYGASQRLLPIGLTIGQKVFPTLECAKKASDSYSRYTINSNLTERNVRVNGDLKHPIALLSGDEYLMAGSYNGTEPDNYLVNEYKGFYNWSMTPEMVFSDGTNLAVQVISDNLTYNFTMTNYNEVRPVVNLKKDVVVTGSGTVDDPYVVK